MFQEAQTTSLAVTVLEEKLSQTTTMLEEKEKKTNWKGFHDVTTYNNNNNVHLSFAHQLHERSHDTF